jgi:hypothetical protein
LKLIQPGEGKLPSDTGRTADLDLLASAVHDAEATLIEGGASEGMPVTLDAFVYRLYAAEREGLVPALVQTESEQLPISEGALRRAPGFGAATPAGQEQLRRLLGGTQNEVSVLARRALFGSAEQQALPWAMLPPSAFQRLLHDPMVRPHAPDLIALLSRREPLPWTRMSETRIDAHPFRTGVQPAVEIGFKVGTVALWAVLPESAAHLIRPPHTEHVFHDYFVPGADEVGRMLALLPLKVLRGLSTVTVEPKRARLDPQALPIDRNGQLPFACCEGARTITLYPLAPHLSDADYCALFLADGVLVEMARAEAVARWGENERLPAWDGYRHAVEADGISPSRFASTGKLRGEAIKPSEPPLLADYSESQPLRLLLEGSPAAGEFHDLFPHRSQVLNDLAGYP